MTGLEASERPPLRVLHLSTPRSWRGGEQQAAYLLQGLRLQGVESLVLCPEGAALAVYCSRHAFQLETFPGFGPPGLTAARLCARLAASGHFDCIHTHDARAHSAAVLAAVLFGMRQPIIVSRRVDFPLRSGFMTQWKYRHKQVCAIVCVSQAIREVVRASLQSEKRLEVVYSGVDLQRFGAGSDGRLRRELQIDPDVPLIANVAATAPHKDYPTFIRTAERLVKQGIKAHFVIIGDGPDRAALQASVDAMPDLRGRLTFTGFRDDIERILPELDVFLITSRTEGLGTSILDAFAAGVPVVATRAGGIPELVRHESTGLSAPVADDAALAGQVARLLHAPDLRATLIKQARVFVQDFDWRKTAAATLEIYQSCVRRS